MGYSHIPARRSPAGLRRRRRLTTDHAPLTTNHWPKTIDHWPETTAEAATAREPLTNDHRSLITDHLSQTTDHWAIIMLNTVHRPLITDVHGWSGDVSKPLTTNLTGGCLRFCDLLNSTGHAFIHLSSFFCLFTYPKTFCSVSLLCTSRKVAVLFWNPRGLHQLWLVFAEIFCAVSDVSC